MNWLDNWITKGTRRVARQTSRRDFLSRVGVALVGSAAVPLLPVARANAADSPRAPQPQEQGDPLSCEYWRYCALDGFLCGCCGGSANTCPPGTEPSPVTWIGTCRNPVDGEGLHHFVQRLLRQNGVRPLPVQSQRRRPARVPAGEEQRHQLVSRHEDEHVPLLDVGGDWASPSRIDVRGRLSIVAALMCCSATRMVRCATGLRVELHGLSSWSTARASRRRFRGSRIGSATT